MSGNPTSSASAIRAQLLLARSRLTCAQNVERSLHVCDRFKSYFPKFWNGLKVATLRSMPSEVQVSLLDPWLLSSCSQLCFPRLIDKNGKMEMATVAGDSQWRFNAFGIQEPSAGASLVSPKDLDVIFVPCVGVTPYGQRIGMGKGYYDRYLAQAPQALKVTLAFDFQLVDKLEQSSWDLPVDWIVTDRRQARTERLSAWLKGRGLKLESS